jgi:hypothetical protein
MFISLFIPISSRSQSHFTVPRDASVPVDFSVLSTKGGELLSRKISRNSIPFSTGSPGRPLQVAAEPKGSPSRVMAASRVARALPAVAAGAAAPGSTPFGRSVCPSDIGGFSLSQTSPSTQKPKCGGRRTEVLGMQ